MPARRLAPWIAVVVVAGIAAGGACSSGCLQRQAGSGSAAGSGSGSGSGSASEPGSASDPGSASGNGSVDELVGLWGQDFVRGPVSTGPIELFEQGGAWRIQAMGQEGACQAGPPPGAARALVGRISGDLAGGLESVLAPGAAARVSAAAGKPAAGKPAHRKPAGAAVKARLWCPLGASGHGLRLVDGAPQAEGARALWVQPAVPMVARGGYASAVELRRQATGRFTGETTLQATRLHVVLAIGKRPTGEVTAFLREREQNLGRLVGVMQVRRRGDEIELASASGMALPAKLLGAAAGPTDGWTIELPLPDSDLVLKLARLSRGDALAAEMYPPPTGAAPAAYQPPAERDDGWPVARSVAEVGISAEPLLRMSAELARQVPSTWSDLAVHGVVVARRGKLVFERAFAGHTLEELHDIRSVGKSYATTLLGLAIDRRELRLDSSVLAGTGLPAPGTAIDPRWSKLKARHLASMSSGLACEDEVPDSPGNEDRVQHGDDADWHRATLALPMEAEPGSRGVYCTMGINLLGAMLERQSLEGGWLPDQFVERLARPLQMSRYLLNLQPDGQGYLGGGLRLSPRDMAKLGQLFIGKGLWNGQRVISEAWVTQATAAQVSLTAPNDYGLGWWRTSFNFERVAYPAFYASGNGGQLIIGIPSLEAVVVFTGGNYGNRRTWQRLLDDLVPRYVLPALLGRP